jgi:hypothetical protein
MAKDTSRADAKKRAQALVAQVKQRVAKQQGSAPPDADSDEDAPDGAPDGTDGQAAEAEGMAARGAQARGVRKQKAIAKSHITRAQGHSMARNQRSQSRREGK